MVPEDPIAGEELDRGAKRNLRPRCCGFLNGDEVFSLLLDLDDRNQLQQSDLPDCQVEKAPAEYRMWGPKRSGNVNRIDISIDADVSKAKARWCLIEGKLTTCSLSSLAFPADVGASLKT